MRPSERVAEVVGRWGRSVDPEITILFSALTRIGGTMNGLEGDRDRRGSASPCEVRTTQGLKETNTTEGKEF